MNYKEDFWGIKYEAKRGERLTIKASIDDYYLCCYNGVLNLMNKGMCGRTAIFVVDCDFFYTSTEIIIYVYPGTASYIKELGKVRKVTDLEFKLHNLSKLW